VQLKRLLFWALAALITTAWPVYAQTNSGDPAEFSFAVAGDMRSFVGRAPAGKKYFDGACEALKAIGAGALMLSPGDCDPLPTVRGALDRCIGSNYLWYPVVGNHDIEKPENLAWVRRWAGSGIPHLARRGPPGAETTTYSFDVGNSHFVALNNYFDGRSETNRADDLPAVTLDWLEQDLGATRQPFIWVYGHKPIKSVLDMDSGRVRHEKDSISTNTVHLARFMSILKGHRVRAYICGHTHNASVTKVDGVWQADSGHARGGGDPGAPSTFLKIRAIGERAWVDIHRADTNGLVYELRKSIELN
jgi:hypothetical protein